MGDMLELTEVEVDGRWAKMEKEEKINEWKMDKQMKLSGRYGEVS